MKNLSDIINESNTSMTPQFKKAYNKLLDWYDDVTDTSHLINRDDVMKVLKFAAEKWNNDEFENLK